MRRSDCLTLAGAAIAAMLMLTVTGARASDTEGSSDHPLVGRYQGAEIVAYEVTVYDEAALVEGPFSPVSTTGGTGFTTVEGKVTLIYYTLPQGRSTLEVLRNYEQSLKSNGFSIAFTCATSNGSCFESGQPEAGYLLGEAVGDPLRIPKLVDDYVHNWFQEGGRYLLARLDRPGGAIYAALYIGESSRGTVAVVKVVETGELETDKIKVVTASEMQAAIARSGSIAIYGIHFDFDSDAIKPESTPTLSEIAQLLTSQPALRLRIIGHTDNKGSAAYNLDLSDRRAESVVDALVAGYGIASDRLAATGAGLTEPIDTNDTEEGRARNRRVELQALGDGQSAGGAGKSGG
jgi:outer membrane protein OmpA-like peptidoglycan-associated protein